MIYFKEENLVPKFKKKSVNLIPRKTINERNNKCPLAEHYATLRI